MSTISSCQTHIVLAFSKEEVWNIFQTKAIGRVSKENPCAPKCLDTVGAAPSPPPWVTKGTEVLEGCYGRLVHTAVTAPWKWSYVSCQLCFVPPLLLSQSLKTVQHCFLAGLQEGAKEDNSYPVAAERDDQIGRLYIPSLHHYSERLKIPDIQPSTAPLLNQTPLPFTLNHKSTPPPPFPPH